MLYNEACRTLVLIKSNDVVRIFAILIVFLSLVICAFYRFNSVVGAIVILGSYVFGFIACWFLTEYQTSTSVYLQRCASFYRVHVSPFKKPRFNCPVCDKDTCQRHHSIISTNPWKNLYINEELNDAIEHFYNRILEEFVNSWYKNLTNDDSFLGELKVCLRYATASLVNKLLEVNPGEIIGNKLVPCAIKHVDDYLCMQQIAKLKNVSFDNVIVEYLGNRLHVATTNRKNEIEYLRRLTEGLLPEVLPSTYSKCRNYTVLIREIIAGWVFLPLMDIIASPDTINLLVVLSTTYTPKPQSSMPSQRKVEFLQNFVKSDVNHSPFSCDLKVVLKTTELLYAFIQFLKREGPMHILQFCLDLEEFNNKLLTPDMSKQQLETLHAEALCLYKNYFQPESPDFIGCSHEISHYLNTLLKENVYSVSKLRTSEPLYEAYDFAFGILEHECLPLFFHSKEFYNCACVSKPVAKPSSGTKSKKYYESSQGTVAKIGSGLVKIKGALKPNQPVEGSVYQTDLLTPDPNFVEDIILSDCDNIFRDLSAWRVAINAINSIQLGTKTVLILDVIVRRIDTGSEHVVKRKEQDFHVLKAKLIEFHGDSEIPDIQLPTRRSSMLLEMRKIKYEDFIQHLLQKPSLRGSDLLYTFLTTKQDFTAIAAVPVVEDLGNIYQSVAFKLRKEKGQHLDNFMNTLFASTATAKQSKFDWEVGDEADILSCGPTIASNDPAAYNEIFGNNFGIDVEDIAGSYSSSFNPEGMTESLFYLLKHAFKVRESVQKLFAAICSVGQQAVESFFQHFINKVIRVGLSESNLAYLVKLLEGAIFDDYYIPTKEELQKRKETAFTELERIVPNLLQKLVGGDLKMGLVNLLEILQNARYNKQLAYYLLDNIVAEVYPHLNTGEVKDC